ncbi:MAG: hypothetical protein GX383_13120 [Clostridium sp.]|nr:hypothetical protein [Clostridium sp.]
MKNKIKKIDIRILKYEEYVKKHPEKAYGYYCLGRLYLMTGQYKLAEEYFNKSLTKDSNYVLSKVGMIETSVFRKKFLKAVYLFTKYRRDIIDKYVYRVKLVRGVSSFYSKNDLFRTQGGGLFSILFLNYSIYYIKKLVDKESSNIVLKLILCMYYLKTGEKSFYTIQLFKTCVYWDGLDDVLRWNLIERLAELGEKLFYDVDIARKFSTIPDSKCSNEYVSMIFNTALKKDDKAKIVRVYEAANKYNKSISANLLWGYVYWSKKNSFYDASVYDCCKRLMKLGWMDNVIAHMLLKFKEKKAVRLGSETEKALKLFGYMG